jgi:hypothetical protein
MTPEERMQYQLAQQQLALQRQQLYLQQQQAEQQRQAQVQQSFQQAAQPLPSQRSINCTSNQTGNTVYTNCN